MYRSSVCSLDLSGDYEFPYEANDNFELPAQVRKPRTRNKTLVDRLHLAVWNNNTELVRDLILDKGLRISIERFFCNLNFRSFPLMHKGDLDSELFGV